MVSGIEMAARTCRSRRLDQRQVAQQARAAVALHHLVHRAAEVDIDDVEAQVLADARGVGHHLRIGAEQLRGDGVLLRLEGQILAACGVGLRAPQRGADAVRAGELGHDQAAAAQVADEAAEHRVGDAGHGRQHGGRGHAHGSDRELGWEADIGLVSLFYPALHWKRKYGPVRPTR